MRFFKRGDDVSDETQPTGPEPTWRATDPDEPTKVEEGPRARFATGGYAPAESEERVADGPHGDAEASQPTFVHGDGSETTGWSATSTKLAMPVTQSPADTGSRIPAPTVAVPATPDRTTCQECGQPMPTDYELIKNSIEGVSPTDLKHLIVVPFYGRLFAAAPALIELFPASMVYPYKIYLVNSVESGSAQSQYWARQVADGQQVLDERVRYQRNGDVSEAYPQGTVRVNPEAGQVDLLAQAVLALAVNFDVHDEAKMEGLNAALNKYGRSHIRFDPPARIEEYATVATILLGLLREVLGERFTPPVELAWRKAIEYASGVMLAAQATAITTGRGRRRRTV